MTKYQEIDHDTAREIVAEAKDKGLAIQLDRMGGKPYLYYTPYVNHSGVKVQMWSCISYSFRAMPDKTLLVQPTIVEPEQHDSWKVNQLSDEWVVHILTKSRQAETLPKEESPFAGDVVGGWYE